MLPGKRKPQAVLLIVYVLSVGVMLLRAQVPVEVGRRDWSKALPDGEGKGLVLGTCVQCHSLNPVVLQRKSAAQWAHTVHDMIARGAQILPEEIGPITAYLARHFGPGAPQLAATGLGQQSPRSAAFPGGQETADLPEGDAKALLLRSCVQCHAISRITEQRKDEAGWRASVKDMVRLGAKLRPEESEVVVAYLVKHFSRQAATPAGAPVDASGTGAARPTDLASLLPDGEGKGLVLGSCTQCHNLGYVVRLRKDAAGWRHTVEDMIARGAQLTAEEAEIMTRYLAEHLSKKEN